MIAPLLTYCYMLNGDGTHSVLLPAIGIVTSLSLGGSAVGLKAAIPLPPHSVLLRSVPKLGCLARRRRSEFHARLGPIGGGSPGNHVRTQWCDIQAAAFAIAPTRKLIRRRAALPSGRDHLSPTRPLPATLMAAPLQLLPVSGTMIFMFV